MNRIIKILYLSLFFLTPIIFTSHNSELFELPKMYFVYMITLLIVIVHLYSYIKGQTPLFKRSFLDWPLFIFLSSQILSTIFSIDIHTSIFGYYSRLNGGLLSLLTYAILYWILIVYIDDKFKKTVVDVSLISGFLVTSFGIAQHFGVDKHVWVQDVQNRIFSTLGQPNWLAAYICILLPFALDKILNSKSKLLFTTYCLLFTSYYLSLLFTKSKSGILAALISLGIYFIIQLLNKPKNLFLLITVYCLLITSALFISNPIRDYIFPQKISNLSLDISNSSLNITPSEDIRKIVWQGSYRLWQQFPLLGTGPETFAYAYYWTRPASHNLTSEWDFLYNKAHNEYLNYLATTGALGFGSYLLLILVILIMLIKNTKTKNNNLPILASIVTILITNGAGFSVVVTSLYLFLLPALLVKTTAATHNKPPPVFPKSIAIAFITISFYFLAKTLLFYLADLTYAVADTLDNNQQYQNALTQIQLSVSSRPNEPVYLTKYANLLAKMSLIANNQQQTDLSRKYATQASDTIIKATSISPFSINLWKERAQIYYYLSAIDTNYYVKAVDALIKASLLAPTDAKTFFMLAEFYHNIKDTDNSIKYYQLAIDLKPNYDHAYFALGKTYFDQQKYELALPLFESTLKYAPTNTDAENFLAFIATVSGKKK